MRFSILGAGAMGSLFGGLLAEAGHAVQLIDTNSAHVSAVQRQGLSLTTSDHGTRQISSVDACLPEEAVAARTFAECLIVFTKTVDSRAALAAVRPIIGPDTFGLSLQNGLGNLETLHSFFTQDRCLIGVTSWPAELIEPGSVRSQGTGSIELQVATHGHTHSSVAESVASSFNDAGLRCAPVDDLWTTLWEKLAFNAALNSVCAATGSPVGRLGLVPNAIALTHHIVKEVCSVAAASGVAVNEMRCLSKISAAIADHPTVIPSTLQDLLAHRPTEIGSINGAVVAEAEKYGVPVPCTKTVLTMVQLIEQRQQAVATP
ncbi:MAG: ketopantoate reductase family protein [Comamonadaceae bacterium]|nr:ketopantoate reductase family protein [Comamonadaceae bacterium]